MRKFDEYDRRAQAIVNKWRKEHEKLQGVKPLPDEFWTNVWTDLHMALRASNAPDWTAG